MTLLNEADNIYIGALEADAVYVGATKIWPAALSGPSGPTASLLVSYTPGGDRSDIVGEVGVRLGIGPTPISVTWMGMRVHTGNSGPRTLNLYEYFADTLQATVTVDLTGKTAGDWVWAGIAPVTLAANGYYALMMATTAGMQPWNDIGPSTMIPAIANHYYCYRAAGSGISTGGPDMIFGGGFDLGWVEAPRPPVMAPPVMTGLAVWHDADQLALTEGAVVTAWPNLGSANQPTIVGTPPILRDRIANGRRVVRFSSTGGGLRGNNTSIYSPGYPMQHTWTMLYVARWFGPTGGRCFTAPYPEGENVLIGYHTSGFDCMHVSSGYIAWPTAFGMPPGPWRLYAATERGRCWRPFLSERRRPDRAGGGLRWAELLLQH